ncbi:hypothetical protein ACET8U_22735 [Aeromonas veronii]
MSNTSVNTYARAFSAHERISDAAGNYKNTMPTKIAKIVIGVLTIGIGYGIMHLIEKLSSRDPKVREFCQNAVNIHTDLSEAVALGRSSASVNLPSGQIICFEETKEMKAGKMEPVVKISFGEHDVNVAGTMKDIVKRIEGDFNSAPGIYHLENGYLSLANKECNKIKRTVNEKNSFLLKQEIAAADNLGKAINRCDNNKLSKLSNEQIRIYFPFVYVEAKHKLNPVVAYNKKDIGDRGNDDPMHDDNVAMLNGYADFLNAIIDDQAAKARGESLSSRASNLLEHYFTLAGNLTNTEPHRIFSHNADASYQVNVKEMFKGEELVSQTNKATIKTISCGHDLGIFGMGEKIAISDCHAPEYKKEVMQVILQKYLDAIDKKDITKVQQCMIDYQFLHLLPNANGRSCQIMRDCALMLLGFYPLASLTSNSNYLSPIEPVNLDHIIFMETMSKNILDALEKNELTLELGKHNAPDSAKKLIEIANTTNAEIIKFDIKQFLGGESLPVL